MAPVQTFSSSPITAAKAPSATAAAESPSTNRSMPPATTTAASASRYGPPPAQPGSRPPAPTGTASSSVSPPQAAITQATPTQPLPSDNSPPAPQPGAVPTPPSTAAAAAASQKLPPPPKKGETLGPEHTAASSDSSSGYPPPTQMPVQMAYAPPTASHSLRGTSANPFPSPYASGPTQLPVGTGLGGGINRATDMSHPPGYQQDAQAAEFSSGQRAAHNAYVAQNSDFASNFSAGGGVGGLGGGDGEGSIWNTAKKWASAAGDKLAEAEGEVWKAVNKDQK